MQLTSVNLGGLRFKPTPVGWLFVALILLGWIMAVNYNNNLLYMVTYVLFSLMLMALLLGVLNLRQVNLIGVTTHSAFVGERLHIQFNVVNEGFSAAEGVFLTQQHLDEKGKWVSESGDMVSLAPSSVQVLSLDSEVWRRGQIELTPPSLTSVYPIGLFAFYRPLKSELSEWVFPAPVGDYPLEDYLNQYSQQSGVEADEMQTIRPYQPSDSPSHINWKVYARSGEMVTCDYDGGVSVPSVVIDEEVLKNLALEERLSQLTKWVIEAENMGGEYGLKLKTSELDADKGLDHRQACLMALASYDSDSNPLDSNLTKSSAIQQAWSNMQSRFTSAKRAKV